MEKETHSLHLFLSFLIILSLSVTSRSHGNQQAKVHRNIQNLRFEGHNNPEMDKSDFEAEEIDIEAHLHDQEGLKEKDRILRFPGQPVVRFSQYGGYVTVDEGAGRAFYYYFVEAYRNKDSLPLLLWLNGGPGCSSLYGAMEELGPFKVHNDGKTLYRNKYSWIYAANVLFLETPAGVGFTYSNRSSDYDNSGDKITASDNYVFLLNWLERFPEYKNTDFYIAGESYAGHFVPELAHTILQHNIKANDTIINLKGIMIGNAAINHETDTKGMYDFLGSHAMISDSTASAIDKFCDFSQNETSQRQECNAAKDEAYRDVFQYINIYNIYAPLCQNPNLTATPKNNSIVTDPCSDYYLIAYLNQAEVQEALHANVTKLKYEWSICSDVIPKWGDSPSSIIPLLHELLNHRLRVWIFSGDVDGRVPVTSTQYSLNSMNLEIKTSWHPWFFNGEVGGYTQVYQGDLTFATIREAGHQVPSYQPARAPSLIKHFLDGTPLPNTKTY